MIGMKAEALFCRPASGDGVSDIAEGTKMFGVSIYPDIGDPTFVAGMPADPDVTAGVINRDGLVAVVLTSRDCPQIDDAIVRADAVDMVNVTSGPFAMGDRPDDAMRFYPDGFYGSTKIALAGTAGQSLFTGMLAIPTRASMCCTLPAISEVARLPRIPEQLSCLRFVTEKAVEKIDVNNSARHSLDPCDCGGRRIGEALRRLAFMETRAVLPAEARVDGELQDDADGDGVEGGEVDHAATAMVRATSIERLSRPASGPS